MFGSGLLAVHHADTEVVFFFRSVRGGVSESGRAQTIFSWPGLHYSRYHSFISNVDTKNDTRYQKCIKSEKYQTDSLTAMINNTC